MVARADDAPKKLDPWLFIRRGLRLRCPECGISPIFIPARRVRSIWDWFTPLDGCPRCGYAYEREQGYFLLAVWGVNYGVVAGLGLLVSFTLDHFFGLSTMKQIFFVIAPMPILSFLIARHAKSMFIALDHYFDPHLKDPPAKANADDESR
jgi:uncharacterized protein (DUF983 family)